jgi:hypothetical protein
LLRPGEETALLALLLDVFGTWPPVALANQPVNYLRWKLELGFAHDCPAVVMEDNDRLVGAIVRSAHPVMLGGSEMLAITGGDVAVLPEYRERGLFGQLLAYSLASVPDNIDLMFGYEGGHSAVKRVSRSSATRSFGSKIEVLTARGLRLEREPGSLQLEIASNFDSRVDALWERASREFDFAFRRTSGDLNRRYADERVGPFRIVLASDQEGLAGYVVSRRRGPADVIADILARPRSPHVLETLLSAASHGDAAEIECWLPVRHPYRPAFAEAGFTTSRTQRLIYRSFSLSATDEQLLRSTAARLHVTAGDTDLV